MKNVLGQPLEACCTAPMTGFYRDGYCRTGPGDVGLHTVCAKMTPEFLDYARSAGNDLSSPRPYHDFPGLKPGDSWCLCVERWVQALQAGCAPPLLLQACHLSALEFVDLEVLMEHRVK